MTEREPEQVAFEGQVVRQARRRRIDPLRIGVAIAVVGLAAAILKPWDGLAPTTETSPGPAALASPAAASSAKPSPAGPAPVVDAEPTPAIDWATAAAVIVPHDAWGVRAVVVEPGVAVIDPHDGLAERWVATDPPDLTAPPVSVPVEERTILAVGLTFPPRSTPIDVRIRRETEDHTWEWIDARPLDANPAGGAFLFAAPTVDGRDLRVWPSGDYRFDVLDGGRIASIEVRLPGRFGRIPLSAIAPRTDPLVAPVPVDLSSVDPGAFAVVDGGAVPVAVQDTGSVLDPAAAWLDVIGRRGASPDAGPGGDLVGDAYLPQANGLGVLLPSGADDLRATLRRIDVDGPAAEAIRPVGTFTSIGTGVTPYAVFAAPNGRAFPAGLYAIESRWRDGTGNVSRVDHIELRPGPADHASRLLDAARYVVDDRGDRPALLLFTQDRVGWLPITAGRTTGADVFDEAGCEPPVPGLDTGSTNLLAFAGLSAQQASRIRIRAIFSGGRQADVPLLISSHVAPAIDPGLTLVAPAVGDVFGSGVYRVTIGAGAGARSGTLCLGPLVYQ